MPWLVLLRIVGPILAVAAIVAGLFGFGYHSGKTSVQRLWDADKDAQAKATAADYLRRSNANVGNTDDYRKKAQQAAVAAAALRAERDQLLAVIADRAADTAARPGADDGSAGAIVLGECVRRYEAVASVADRLSTQVTGLQGYVGRVCQSTPAETPH